MNWCQTQTHATAMAATCASTVGRNDGSPHSTSSILIKINIKWMTIAALKSTALWLFRITLLLLPVTGVKADSQSNNAIGLLSTAQARSLYEQRTVYKIMRKGKRVGSHTLSIKPASTDNKAQNFTVSVASLIKIKMLKITVFSFDYQATELWKDDILDSVVATTLQNGDRKRVSASRQTDGFKLEVESGIRESELSTSTAELFAYTSNHWHPGVVNSQQIFNTLTGNVNKVTIESLGKEELSIGRGAAATTVKAERFRYSGGLDAESWYGDDGRWLQLSFKGSDGSTILYQYAPEESQ